MISAYNSFDRNNKRLGLWPSLVIQLFGGQRSGLEDGMGLTGFFDKLYIFLFSG